MVYKIRRRSDGKYSTGGTDPNFHRDGKAWNCMGSLRSHLRLVFDGGNYKDTLDQKIARFMSFYGDCDIIRYEEAEGIPCSEELLCLKK